MAASSIMESLFQRTLEDMIKGLRSHPLGEAQFLANCLDEARREARSMDPDTKVAALEKLAYARSLLGIDHLSPDGDFHVVEAMSLPHYAHRRVGYLAASLAFSDATEILLLLTNLLRKALSASVANSDDDAALALHFLSVAASPDLAADLTPEIFALLSSGKPAVRKKAVAVLVRVFDRAPDSIRVCFKRLVDCLDASDPQVVSAAIGVFCEVAVKDPKSYLPLAPEFYRFLVDSKNNWVLIKVVKIFAALAPLEKRLGNKIVGPICEIMMRTGAKSLMFECVRALVSSFSDHEDAVVSAIGKIREMLIDEDPNLNYLGLQALLELMPKRLSAVLENKDAVVKFLNHGDPSIRRLALSLVMAMVSEDNVVEISRVLVNHALKSDPEFCNEILGAILATCSQNLYNLVVDFDWYVALLGEISRSPHCAHGEEIERQLIDIALRVKDARFELVRVCRDLLIDPALLGNTLLDRILCAAAWIAGEYIDLAKNPIELVEALLQPRTHLLPPGVRAVYVQSVFKILVSCLYSYVVPSESENHVDSCNGIKISGETKDLDKQIAALNLSEQPVDHKSQICTSNFDRLVSESLNSAVQGPPEENYPGKQGDGGKVSFMVATERDLCSYDSLLYLLNLIKSSISPLVDIYHVDVQERANNVLGLINSLEEIPGFLMKEKVGDASEPEDNKQSARAFQIIELMYGIFSDELGPVSACAQKMVQVPVGLVLKRNLSDLDIILESDASLSSTFAVESQENREWDASLFNFQKNEDKQQTNESTSLLSEHRKRHLMYYLPNESETVESNDYPTAKDSPPLNDPADATKDLAKLTQQSLILKKMNRAKPRPVVVKLDEDEFRLPAFKTADVKAQLPSGHAHDVLLDGGTKSSLLLHESVRKPGSSKLLDDKSIKMEKGSGSLGETSLAEKERSGVKVEDRNSILKENKHRSSHKERQKDSSVHGKKEKVSRKYSKKSDQHQTKHTNRQRSKSPVSVEPTTAVIPDFLL